MIKMNLVETKRITNIKPEAWYNEYYDSLIKGGLDDYFIASKKTDKRIDVCHVIDSYITPFNEQMHEAQIIMEPFYRKYDNLPLEERNEKLTSFNEFVEAKERHSKAYKNYFHNIPPGVSEEEFSYYHQLIRGKLYENLEIVFNYNTLKKNAKFLGFLIARHNNLKKKRAYKQLCVPDCKETIQTREKRFKLCEQAIKEGYLITNQLDELNYDIGECYYCFLKEKEKKRIQTPFDLTFINFSYNMEQIFSLIRKNAKWHNIERDLTIYQEKKKGKYLQEIGENFRIDFTTVSVIVKKVSGAVNYWKGKSFEDFVEKKLKQCGLFEKVIKEAGKGECDILAYTKDGKGLYIYSLKNIKIDRKPYWLITKEELLPELKDSKLSSLDYDTHLILLVYDNHHKRVFQTEIDYNHVKNIDISNS